MPSFTERVITYTADGARSLYAVDVDGDGDVDTLSASVDDDTVAWYSNNGVDSYGSSCGPDASSHIELLLAGAPRWIRCMRRSLDSMSGARC